jgi:regulator of replication initiation timing
MTQQDIINENIIKQLEIRVQQDIKKIEELKQNLVDVLLERDELDEQYKKAVARFKDADKRCIEMGTKNAECWDKINELEHAVEHRSGRFDQLDEEYQDLVRICTAIYQRADREAIREMINETLGGDDFESFKNHLGV